MEHKSNLQRIRDSPTLTHITFLTEPQTDHLLALMAAWDFLSLQMPYFTLHFTSQKKKKIRSGQLQQGVLLCWEGVGRREKLLIFFYTTQSPTSNFA